MPYNVREFNDRPKKSDFLGIGTIKLGYFLFELFLDRGCCLEPSEQDAYFFSASGTIYTLSSFTFSILKDTFGAETVVAGCDDLLLAFF